MKTQNFSALVQASMKRKILETIPVGWRGPRVEFLPARAWRNNGSLIGHHLLQPSEAEFFSSMERAEIDGFRTIYVYL